MTGLRTLLLPILVLLAGTVGAEDQPRWSVELKGGEFHSDVEDWGRYFGDNRFGQFGAAIAYKLSPALEIGIETVYRADSGEGFAPGHGIVAGNVRYQLLPVQLTATLRGGFHPDQWLVPYIGAGLGRYSYRVTIEGQGRDTGGTSGTSYRAGLQLLIDRLDPRSAASLKRYNGIDNTYLFFEARESDAEAGGIELGGTAYLGGFLMEF